MDILENEIDRVRSLDLPEDVKDKMQLVKATAFQLSEKLRDIEHIDSFQDLEVIINLEMQILGNLLQS